MNRTLPTQRCCLGTAYAAKLRLANQFGAFGRGLMERKTK